MNTEFAHGFAVTVLCLVSLGLVIWVCATDPKSWEFDSGPVVDREVGAFFKRLFIVGLAVLLTHVAVALR